LGWDHNNIFNICIHAIHLFLLYRFLIQGCKLVGCGSAVPALQITNEDLSKVVDTSDEWIYARTGIRKRRVLSG